MKNKKSVNKEILSQYILLTIVILFVALLISNISSSLMKPLAQVDQKVRY